MSAQKSEVSPSQKKFKFGIFIILEAIVLIVSIVIPLILVSLNQSGSCLHHLEELGGEFWILGRALGFTTLTWFFITSLMGLSTKKLARTFKSYKKARDLHCINASIMIIVFLIHITSLLLSDPWGPLIFDNEYNHIPFPLFITKLWTGILFAIVMISVSFSAFFFRNMRRMKSFGFKNFLLIHYIMLGLSLILAIHVFLINTEILVLMWG